ncbi:AI-2E family transporter [Flavihumibacter petaseus]|uniref:AI-2E family transporter n=1 Tax=Flavihumibacter petaseus NBRC 106054 TaxID=1220578 RepID=A0A0E9N572_9BACT|nr:AI-2E family transporter [Flavihumibacter petaseus]GAO44846.1 hypothetical protein FPE01S_04_00890 [Flavihumibacter petaseus NBRC 106054]
MENAVVKKDKNAIEVCLVVLLFLVLLWALYKVIGPFFGVFTYACILAVSFRHFFHRMQRSMGGKKVWAAITYAFLLIAIMAIPFLLFLNALGKYFHHVQEMLVNLKSSGIPALPEWIASLPLVGDNLQKSWTLMQQDPNASIHVYEHQIKAILGKILHEGAGLLGSGAELILGIIISAVFLVHQENLLRIVYRASQHIIGKDDGPALLDAAAKAVRGVAIGVMGTGFITAVLAWLAYTIAGIPLPTVMAALIFLFTIIQIGAWVVWVPLGAWLLYNGHTGQAAFVGIFGIVLILLDTFLKPVLIAKSGKLPILVLFVGVLGGLAAWGFTGMFKGAIVLAVAYTIFQSWMSRHPITEVPGEPETDNGEEGKYNNNGDPEHGLSDAVT